MTIYVDTMHIKKGERGSALVCPVARAVREMTGAQEVVVMAKCISLTDQKGEVKHYRTSPITQQFITDFDMGIAVSPISFTLREGEVVDL